MKKHVLIETILILTISGISFWNIQQEQENLSLRESAVAQEENQKELKKRQKELLQENKHLSAEAKSSSEALKEMRKNEGSSGVDVDSNSEFINIVTKLFEANLNFTPENYADRKKEVSSYLSKDLNRDYFGQNRDTYLESNDTTSQLISLEIYPKLKNDTNIEGLIVVQYKSKKIDQKWSTGINIFKVTYDGESKKLIKISNLGGGYFGDDFNS